MDFSMPWRSLVGDWVNQNVKYSDISNDDLFKIPCSQKNSTTMRGDGRWE